MPVLPTNSTLLATVMHQLRIPVTNTTELAKVQDLFSLVYGDICAKQDWWWLLRRTVINTEPKITTGTVSLTENSVTATLSSAPTQFSSNVSVANYVIVVPSNSTDSGAVYRIRSHTSGATALTLDGAYTGTTDTAAEYKLYRVSYDLPTDCAKLLHVHRFGVRNPMERMGIEDLSFLQQTSQSEGKPSVYSVYDFSTTGAAAQPRQLQIFPFPDQNYRMEVWYKHQIVGDTSASDLDIPIDYQQVLAYGTLARGYPIFLNDLERGAYYQGLFNDVMALMSAQQREYASDHPGIAIDMRAYRNAPVRGRWRGSLGTYFDTLPSVP